MFKLPEDDSKYQWTNHVKDKMIYYRISESLIKRIVRFPKRIEKGIAPGTIAAMQPTGGKKRPQEIWVMYQEVSNKQQAIRNKQGKVNNQKQNPKNLLLNSLLLTASRKRIISAWRYPGTSPVGKPIPIPEDILQELNALVD